MHLSASMQETVRNWNPADIGFHRQVAMLSVELKETQREMLEDVFNVEQGQVSI